MKYKNRALALLLSVVMVLTFMPAMAFAEDVPADESGQPAASEEQADAEAQAAKEAEEKAAAEAQAAKEAEEKAAAEAQAAKEAEAQAAKEAAPVAKKATPAKAAANGEAEAPKVTFNPNGGYLWVWDEETEEGKESYDPVSYTTQIVDDGEGNVEYYIYDIGTAERRYYDGYEFEGWALNGEIVDFDGGFYVKEDTTLTAKWRERDGAIFDANGGTFTDEEGVAYDKHFESPTDEGKIYTEWAPTPKHDGAKALAGWSLSKNGPVIEDYYVNYEGSGHMTLYAVWEDAWVVTFDANGGYFDGDKSKTTQELNVLKSNARLSSDDIYRAEDDIFKDGNNVFSYWTDASGKKLSFDDDDDCITISGNTTFTANWEEGYAVTLDGGDQNFEDNESSQIVFYRAKNSSIYLEGNRVEGREYQSTDGKVVVGWKLDKNSEDFLKGDYELTEDITLYAVWGSRYKILLNMGEGSFYGDETCPMNCVELDTLDEYSGKKAVSASGEEVITYSPIFNAEQVNAPDGKILEGWYYDAELTQPVEPGTVVTADFFNARKDEDERLNLYAKYTDDYTTVTLDANGGYLYGRDDEDVSSLDLVCPAGRALDLSDRYLERYNDNDDRYTFLGWYTDAEGNTNADVTEDDIYVPSVNTTLYAKWREPLPDVYLDLESKNDCDFYLDGDYEIYAYIDNNDGADLSGCKYEAIVEVYDISEGGSDDIGRLEPVKVLEGADFISWGYGSDMTLYGAAIEKELDKLGKDIDDLRLGIRATIKTEDGEELADSGTMIIQPRKPYVDYQLDNLFNEDDGVIGDGNIEFFVGETKDGIADGRYIGRYENWGCKYNSEYPDGDEFEYEVTNVVSSNTGVIKIEKYTEDDSFWISPVKQGTANITVSYKDIDGNTQKVTRQATVVQNKYYVWFDDDEHYDEDAEMVIRKAVPGSKVELKADGVRRDIAKEYTDGFTYKWSFEDEAAADYATIEGNGNTATVTIKADADPSEREIAFGVKVEVVANEDGKVRAADTALVYVRKDFYELGNMPTVDRYMRRNQTVEFKPELRYFSVETKDLPGGYEVVNKPLSLYYYDGCEEDGEEDSEEVQVITVTSGGKTVNRGETVNGAFTLKRIADAYGSLAIYVYDSGEDDSDEHEVAYIRLDEIININKAKVTGIPKAYTYTGKVRKPVPEEVYALDSEGDERNAFREDGDYKLSYKNNKNVGKASVTITGLGCFYGTKTINFNINPKGTTLKKLAGGKKSLTVTWNKQATQTTGYQIQYGLKSNFKGAKTVTIKKNKTVKTTIKKLKAKKTYYVRIRTYKQIGNAKYYSAWSKAKKIKTK